MAQSDGYARVSFNATSLEGFLQARANGDTSIHLAARQSLEDYRALLTRSMPRLSVPEASLIVDALNGAIVEPIGASMLPIEISDAIQLNALDQKWGVDGEALVARLVRLPMFAQWAVCEAARAFWLDRSVDTEERLRQVGLVRSHADREVEP